MDLRWMSPGDEQELVQASALFDEPVRPEWARLFLSRSGHHLCLAYVDQTAVGFVSGIEMTHPDKGTEMFLYEMGVQESHQGRGIGTGLVRALVQRAEELGCQGMWVLTEEENVAAGRTYRAAGAGPADPCVQLEWSFPVSS
jgi:ribosomal protein S18 acetylase RimI-like enzyme